MLIITLESTQNSFAVCAIILFHSQWEKYQFNSILLDTNSSDFRPQLIYERASR